GGADECALERQAIEPAQRTVAALRMVFEHATRPVFTVFRRYTFEGSEFVYAEADEAQRMQLQLDLLDVGSAGFDMELDTFDPQPRLRTDSDAGKRRMFDRATPPGEVSTDPRAVERQIQLIEDAHRRGGEVLAS